MSRALAVIMVFCIIMALSIFVLMPMAGLTVKNSSAGASKNDHSAVAAVPFSILTFLNIEQTIHPQ